MAFTLNIDGTDITPYIAAKGVKWSANDLDGESAGRTLDGKMRRDRIASKIRLDITCKSLKTIDARTVLTAISPEWVNVTYTDPREGGSVTKKMYSNNVPASIAKNDPNGETYWEGIVFPLIEE